MRMPRKIEEGATYHVTARTNKKEMIFLEKYVKDLLLLYINRAKKKFSFDVISIIIMGNHIHMVIKPAGKSNLSEIMKWILAGFAMKYNRINGFSGHVWYDRFKSKIVDSLDYLKRVIIYIANNPVRAGIVDHPLDYNYSSISAFKKERWRSCDKQLRRRFYQITEMPSIDIQKWINQYLEKFEETDSKKVDPELSFKDRKPGRPKK